MLTYGGEEGFLDIVVNKFMHFLWLICRTFSYSIQFGKVWASWLKVGIRLSINLHNHFGNFLDPYVFICTVNVVIFWCKFLLSAFLRFLFLYRFIEISARTLTHGDWKVLAQTICAFIHFKGCNAYLWGRRGVFGYCGQQIHAFFMADL